MKRKYLKKNHGFTLIELIGVLGILIVIMSISIPTFKGIVEDQKIKADMATAAQIARIAELWSEEQNLTLSTYVEVNDNSEVGRYIIKSFKNKKPKISYMEEGSWYLNIDNNHLASVKLGNIELVKSGELKGYTQVKNEITGIKEES